ncbi:GNAT family N-acetyltransferase [Nocardioides sp. TRM66260-LWL]|uniref:GNAT family N-acetyltransferase n=1 Tax=Nocardioides sp. TRM66260-LWL TaxID=2874478 RepID=UPI001CC54B71|nr:GNAT family N-acetyltransferase [Nocardioides sp. TRM66260-LWL]MBZ5735564.1 GNAT family N-acetyltransferase [Nocardioides sp. TRM66260-LWL]
MSRRVVRLTLDRLEEARTPCGSCLFWELDPVRRARVPEDDASHEKLTWLSTVLREWGSCGRAVLVDGVVRGYVVYAPAAYVPGAAGFATAPASPDAVLLTSAWVHPDDRGCGLGRMLVQGMARDLIGRGGIRAVEAFASARGDAEHVLPQGFLEAVGFRTHRPHPRVPRLRMDLRSALTWRDEVEAALERLVGVVRPTPAPAPAHRDPAARTDA